LKKALAGLVKTGEVAMDGMKNGARYRLAGAFGSKTRKSDAFGL